MNLKFVLFLLWSFYVFSVFSEGDIKTTQSPSKYPPCDNKILIGYETTTKLAASSYQKQINFLSNMLFESWTHFDKLAVKTSQTTCDVFSDVNKDIEFDHFNIVLFLREFNQKDVKTSCNNDITFLKRYASSVAFVILSEDVIIEELEAFFPSSQIIKWDIDNKDVPDNWRDQFYDAYGCNSSGTKTTHNYLSTTTENPVDCCQCKRPIFVAYDKSNGLSGDEFKRLQDFLIKYVFQNWSSFDQLTLVSFADSKTKDELKYLKSKKMLDSFIRNDKQVDKKPSLCKMLKDVLFVRDVYANIFLISEFTAEDISEDCKLVQQSRNRPIDFVTFVTMTGAVQIDLLSKYYPQAQIIKWNVSGEETPKNWEWQFAEAYNCSLDKKHEQQIHPCDNKILIGYDESLNATSFNTLKAFLINNLFDNDWTVFENLELIAYSENMRIQSFGSMNNLNEVYNFINNGTKVCVKTSLCQVFNELASTYTLGVNIILFVSEFHKHQGDECPLWIKKVRDNANSITFVNLTKNVDTDYLLSKIPYANFISWNISKNSFPDDWKNRSSSAFGCENFYVESQEYPCSTRIAIAFDRSRYLNPPAYQRLTTFLSTKLFINEWTTFGENLSLASYSNDTDHIYPTSLLQAKYFIHKSLKTEQEPALCKSFQLLKTNPLYLVLFVSKFDDEVLTSECVSDPSVVNPQPKQITFIKLGPLVNETYIMEMFPTAIIIDWNIEQEPELTNWTQVLWESFGCSDDSPIVFPHSTSTVAPTTKSSTSTKKISTPLISSKQTMLTSTTIKLSTVTTPLLITTTTSFKTPDSKGNSKEKILLGIFIPLIIIGILIFIACFCFYRRKQRQQLVANMASNNHYTANEACGEEREEDPWEIGMECLQINFLDKLGSGAFGDVYLGRINGPAPITQIYNDSPHCQRFQNCEVAIKSLPQMQVDEHARSEFQKEIEFMKSLKFHNNVVAFLGYVYDPISPLMILEYCANGDLLHFIKSNKQKFIDTFETNSNKTLISFAWQISSGLEYLGSLGLIHRDIAARNILLDAQNVCKISDFGLCRNSTNQLYLSSGGRLPIKWMAIESLKDNIFSTKTDVWSYGVLLWELFTLGQIPYAHVDNVLKYLDDGKRLEKPQYCSEDIYNLMMDCWQTDSEERPAFTTICQLLAKMIETATMHYNYVDTLALIEQIEETVEDDEVTV